MSLVDQFKWGHQKLQPLHDPLEICREVKNRQAFAAPVIRDALFFCFFLEAYLRPSTFEISSPSDTQLQLLLSWKGTLDFFMGYTIDLSDTPVVRQIHPAVEYDFTWVPEDLDPQKLFDFIILGHMGNRSILSSIMDRLETSSGDESSPSALICDAIKEVIPNALANTWFAASYSPQDPVGSLARHSVELAVVMYRQAKHHLQLFERFYSPLNYVSGDSLSSYTFLPSQPMIPTQISPRFFPTIAFVLGLLRNVNIPSTLILNRDVSELSAINPFNPVTTTVMTLDPAQLLTERIVKLMDLVTVACQDDSDESDMWLSFTKRLLLHGFSVTPGSFHNCISTGSPSPLLHLLNHTCSMFNLEHTPSLKQPIYEFKF